MNDTVVLIDVSEISRIMSLAGIEGLNVLAERGDYFFLSEDAHAEMRASKHLRGKKLLDFESWVEGLKSEMKILDVSSLTDKEKEIYDPKGKRHSRRGGKEIWDMTARKFMDLNPDFDFEVITQDIDFAKNRYRDENGKQRMIVDRPFRFWTVKRAMLELVTHPDLDLTKEQYMNIVRHNYGKRANYKQGVLVFPGSYEEARRERADRIRRLELGSGPDGDRGKKFSPGFGQGEPDMLRLGVDTKLPVTGALQEGLRNPHDLARPVPFGQKAGLPLLEGSSGKLISEASRVAGRIDFRKGSVIAGTATGLLLATTVVAIALEHDLPPSEVAAAMGIDLKSIAEGLAQSAAEDAAVSVLVGALASSTGPGAPVAAAVAQVIRQGYKLYQSGEDLADTYQLLHLLVTEIDHGKVLGNLGESAAEQLGIATEDLNDFLYGESPEIDWRATEKAARAALGNDRQKQIEFGQDLALSRDANKDRELFVDKYLPFVVFEGRSDEERGHQQLAPGSDGSVEPEAIVAPQGDVDDGALQPVPANPLDANGEGSRKIDKEDPFARKTSYDRYQRLGTSPEEEAEALKDYHDMLLESYLEMDGHREAAHEFALWKFRQKWSLSNYSPETEGTVLKYPVETAYPDIDGEDRHYVRENVETVLASEGIKASKWYLTPNEHTGHDRARGVADEDGYGPRMTLLYDDETGVRHKVTDRFQVNVLAAEEQVRARRLAAGEAAAKQREPHSPPAGLLPQTRGGPPAAN